MAKTVWFISRSRRLQFGHMLDCYNDPFHMIIFGSEVVCNWSFIFVPIGWSKHCQEWLTNSVLHLQKKRGEPVPRVELGIFCLGGRCVSTTPQRRSERKESQTRRVFVNNDLDTLLLIRCQLNSEIDPFSLSFLYMYESDSFWLLLIERMN